MTARIQNTAPQPDVTTGVQHLIKAAYAVYCFGDGDALRTGEFSALQPAMY